MQPNQASQAQHHQYLDSNETPTSGSLLKSWLELVGLHYDPFIILDAATDTHLSDYLVGHSAFEAVWVSRPTFAFAPVGGGKTALRVRTAHACWVGPETNHPFPIPYTPAFLQWGSVQPGLNDHLETLTQAGSIQLLLALAFHPHLFLRLAPTGQAAAAAALAWNLPGDLSFFVDLMAQEGSPAVLRAELDPTFAPLDAPEPAQTEQFCTALNRVAAYVPDQAPPIPTRWENLCDLLLNQLGFNAIYILVDGLDAAQETAQNPNLAVFSLSPLLSQVDNWTEQNIYLKGFLPALTQPIFQQQFPDLFTPSTITTLHWSPELLAEVIRQRVYAASQGAFRSLDAITSPALRNVETILAQTIAPLPREMLVLTRRVLLEHVSRRGANGKIEADAVASAQAWYQNDRIGQAVTLTM